MTTPTPEPIVTEPVVLAPAAIDEPAAVVTPDPVVVPATPLTPPPATTGIDEDKLGRAVAKGLTDAARAMQPSPPITNRPLAQYTVDQLLTARHELNADGTALAPAQLLTIERELEMKRREELYATTAMAGQKTAGRVKVERDYPEFADSSSPLYLKASELIGGDPSALTAKELDIVVKAAAQDLGLQPISKRSAPTDPAVLARLQTVQQIQAASAAAALPRGSGGSAVAAPVKSALAMTRAELEAEIARVKS